MNFGNDELWRLEQSSAEVSRPRNEIPPPGTASTASTFSSVSSSVSATVSAPSRSTSESFASTLSSTVVSSASRTASGSSSGAAWQHTEERILDSGAWVKIFKPLQPCGDVVDGAFLVDSFHYMKEKTEGSKKKKKNAKKEEFFPEFFLD